MCGGFFFELEPSPSVTGGSSIVFGDRSDGGLPFEGVNRGFFRALGSSSKEDWLSRSDSPLNEESSLSFDFARGNTSVPVSSESLMVAVGERSQSIFVCIEFVVDHAGPKDRSGFHFSVPLCVFAAQESRTQCLLGTRLLLLIEGSRYERLLR